MAPGQNRKLEPQDRSYYVFDQGTERTFFSAAKAVNYLFRSWPVRQRFC